jgi:ketosteroid isomerase-like protein
MRGVLLVALTLAVSLIGCGSSQDSATQVAQQKAVDTYAIAQIEAKFHEAVSHKDVDMMMSLFAENSVLTVFTKTYTNKAQIRTFWATVAEPFKPENHWISETPAYQTRVSVNGDTGTL